jgi:flagellar motor switch protein FliG
VKEKDGEEAMTAIIAAIRALETGGEITLIQPDED